MNEDYTLKQLTDEINTALALAEFKGEMSGKMDTLIGEVKALRETDNKIYDSIGKRDEKLTDIFGRLIALETKSTNNRWWIGIASTAAIVIATLLAKYI